MILSCNAVEMLNTLQDQCQEECPLFDELRELKNGSGGFPLDDERISVRIESLSV